MLNITGEGVFILALNIKKKIFNVVFRFQWTKYKMFSRVSMCHLHHDGPRKLSGQSIFPFTMQGNVSVLRWIPIKYSASQTTNTNVDTNQVLWQTSSCVNTTCTVEIPWWPHKFTFSKKRALHVSDCHHVLQCKHNAPSIELNVLMHIDSTVDITTVYFGGDAFRSNFLLFKSFKHHTTPHPTTRVQGLEKYEIRLLYL